MKSVKFSKYNIAVKHNGSHLFFNGMSGALMELSERHHHLIEGHQDQPEMIQMEEPSFFEALKQTRCIIDGDVDEFELIKKRNHRSVYEDKAYRLTINPTMDCNFKCWYCYEGHIKGRMSDATVEKVIAHVTHLIEQRKISALMLGWFGGEPMMTFSTVMHPISVALQALCTTAGIPFTNAVTTNAYLVHEKYLGLYKDIKLNFFQITLDGTREQHNKIRFLKESQRPTYDRIVDNVNLLIANHPDVTINLRINFEDQTLESIEELVNAFPSEFRHKISVDFQRVWQTVQKESGPNARLQELIQIFQDAGFNAGAAANEFVLFRGNKCYADRWYQAVINFDGNVFKCTARDFTPANSEGHLAENGEVIWKDKAANRFARAPFERELCRDCQLLPLCMGPCSQKMLEAGEERKNDFCWMDGLELTLDDFVISRYESLQQKQLSMSV